MRILKELSALIVIDVQERLFPHIFAYENTEINICKLIDGIKALSLPIIVTEQYVKGLGGTIPGVVNALGSHYQPIEKMAFSCCGEDKFTNQLKDSDIKHPIICGIESHVCVLQTTLDLIADGLQPVVIEDCVSSRNPNDKVIAINRMRIEGAIISTCESILFELLQVSGTPEFKAISKIVK